jgi:hypothetical protein
MKHKSKPKKTKRLDKKKTHFEESVSIPTDIVRNALYDDVVSDDGDCYTEKGRETCACSEENVNREGELWYQCSMYRG